MEVCMFLGMPYDYNPDEDIEFHHILKSLQQGVRVEVPSKPESYKFTYAMAQLIHQITDFSKLADDFIKLQAQYSPQEFVYEWLEDWILDCYILSKKYDKYIKKIKNSSLIYYSARANINIQIYFLAGYEPRAIDLIKLTISRKSKFIKEHFNEYLDAANLIFNQYAQKHGGWKTIMAQYGLFDKTYGSYAFAGLPCYPSIPLIKPSYCLYTSEDLNQILKDLQREAESLAREELGMKRVGEGWVSETILYNKIKNQFPETQVIQHGRPAWLFNQHLDVWLPEWLIGIEFHGKQHFEPVDFFGGIDAFKETQRRDNLKKRKCVKNGVTLLIVRDGYDFDELIQKILNLRRYG